jgi:hypothetical protein
MTDWFNKTPGSDIAQGRDNPEMLLLNLGKPQVIKVPIETGFGGVYRCLDVIAAKCPKHDHNVPHYILDGPVCCAECTQTNEFIWYRRPNNDAGNSSTS